MNVPFLDFRNQFENHRQEILSAVESVLVSGHYVLGPQTRRFEERMAVLCGCRHGVGVNSGTDALILALKAAGVGAGDEVVVPAFTFIAPAEAAVQCGAIPVFADVDPRTFCLDPKSAAAALSEKTKAIIPVHLFGQMAAMEELQAIAQSNGAALIEDCAQAIGARRNGSPAGSWGSMGCFSFYPTKNLGAAGDGGLLTTQEDDIDKRLRLLRGHGVERRYYHDVHGVNSRLDEIQAAILNVKFDSLTEWTQRRREVARQYTEGLAELPLETPLVDEGNEHVFHVYAILSEDRDRLQRHLEDNGVHTLIYYPVPLHLQKVYEPLGGKEGGFPVSEDLCRRVLPLPIYPEIEDAQIQYVIERIRSFFCEVL